MGIHPIPASPYNFGLRVLDLESNLVALDELLLLLLFVALPVAVRTNAL